MGSERFSSKYRDSGFLGGSISMANVFEDIHEDKKVEGTTQYAVQLKTNTWYQRRLLGVRTGAKGTPVWSQWNRLSFKIEVSRLKRVPGVARLPKE